MLTAPIDLALIDAIHTSEFVFAQLDLVMAHLAPGGTVILDDIDFSDDMRACWLTVAGRDDIAGAVVVGGHLGVIQVT